MRVLKTFQPGAPGARRFTTRVGERLVCVGYRFDPQTGARFTTVELIAENTRTYLPRTKHGPASTPDPLEPLRIRIGRGEVLLRQQVKAAGGV